MILTLPSHTQLLGQRTPAQFLNEYWQKQPLLIRNAWPDFRPVITPKQLMQLSMDTDIESRIVKEQPTDHYQLYHGPFSPTTFKTLPTSHWTLLVQAVDACFSEADELLSAFNFIPNWRLDDLMVSYATPLGSVGPHYDHYDVFLLQAVGTRLWQWSAQPVASDQPIRADTPLKLLETFTPEHEAILDVGDMLYLPACYAHHGIAQTQAMTYSIGFRAPSVKEMIGDYVDHLLRNVENEHYYQDQPNAFSPYPGELTPAVINHLVTLVGDSLKSPGHFVHWFGQYMTDTRYPMDYNSTIGSLNQFRQRLQDQLALVKRPGSRFAFYQSEHYLSLFVNGAVYLCRDWCVDYARLLCHQRHYRFHSEDRLFNAPLNEPENNQYQHPLPLLYTLYQHGALLFPHESM